METLYTWKKGFFKSAIEIYSGDKFVGSIKAKNWSQETNAELNDKKMRFVTKGFFNPYTIVFDALTGEELGRIKYNGWGNKATLTISGNIYTWKYSNTWGTKWMVSDVNGNLLSYSGSNSKGEISSGNFNETLILTGLFIRDYFWQMVAVMFVVLIPVFIASANN